MEKGAEAEPGGEQRGVPGAWSRLVGGHCGSLSWRGLVHGSEAGLLREHALVVFLYLTGHVSLCLKQLKVRKTLLQPSRQVALHFDPFLKPWNCPEKFVSLK